MKDAIPAAHYYDGMVTQTADGSLRVRVYEPRPWQLWRKLRWLWLRLYSRFDSSVSTVELTLRLDKGRRLNVRALAEPAPRRRSH